MLVYHCRQRAPIENVSSTSGILSSGIFKEDTDDYPKFLWIYCIYNVLNYDAFNDYYYYCHFLSKNHCFFQCKIIFFLKVIRNPASRSLQSIEISLYISCIYEWMKCCQKRRIINEWFILFRDIILLRKSQLVTSYSLKLDVNRCFWNLALSNCKQV